MAIEGNMGDIHEELKDEVRRIDDQTVLGKVEAFVLGMQVEKTIERRPLEAALERDNDTEEGKAHG